MVNDNTPLSHHFLQITEAQGIRQTQADTLRNKINGIMQTPERFADHRHGQEKLLKNSTLPDGVLMRQNRPE
ncbi:hypothetical protein ACO03_21265 (plasmid) [Pantoea ananatis]|nr:hypothetical protein ACO03_21265 [Pantoea ananatis]